MTPRSDQRKLIAYDRPANIPSHLAKKFPIKGCFPKKWIMMLTAMASLFLVYILFGNTNSFLGRHTDAISIGDSRFPVALDWDRLTPSRAAPQETRWRKLTEGFYVYAATYEFKDNQHTDIIVSGLGNVSLLHLWTSNVWRFYLLDHEGKQVHSGRGKFHSFTDHNYETLYRSGQIRCTVSGLSKPFSVLRFYYEFESVEFPAPPERNVQPAPLTFVHCSSPLRGQRYRALDFIEFMEHYLAIGVNRFVFYIEDIRDADVWKLFQHYETKGLLEIRNWTLPVPGDQHEHGQVLALNDCFRRTAHLFDYSVNVDLDEFLVVSNSDGRMLHSLVANGSRDCVVVRTSTMPPLDTPAISPTCNPEPRLTRILRHQDYAYPVNSRTKYVCRARKGMEPGIHSPYPYNHRPPMPVHVANPDEAVLIHTSSISDDGHNFTWIDDTRTLVNAEIVKRNIINVWNTIYCA